MSTNDVTKSELAIEAIAEPAPRQLTPAAQRALAEAEARREEARRREAEWPKEIGGRGGHDPARYGDWEVKGVACDF